LFRRGSNRRVTSPRECDKIATPIIERYISRMATVQPSLFSPSKRAPGQEQAVADVLALTCVKGLGDDGLAKLLDQLRGEGAEPRELFRASRSDLCEHFGLRSAPAEIISGEAPRLAAEADELYRQMQSLGGSVLLPGTAEYPERLESFYGSAPPVLYVCGNRALLNSACFAIVNSGSPTAESLAFTFALASRLAEAGKTLLTSPETPSYNLVGLGGKLSGTQRVIILHRGLFDFLEQGPGREPLPLARRAGDELDFNATLLVSPFRLSGRWQKGNGPRRDKLLVGLADRIVAIEVKPGGRMEKLCLQAQATERRLFACQFTGPPATPAANAALLSAGASPLVPDEAGSNVDLLLRDGAAALCAVATADDLPRRRALGQYFTPPIVAGFIWDAIDLLSPNKPSRTARVIDPACGDGVFLRAAVERGHDPAALLGVDIDEHLIPRWQADSLMHGAGLFRANGLVDNPTIGLESGTFDVIVGNPPFAGQGLKHLLRLIEPPLARRGKEQLDLLGGKKPDRGTNDSAGLPAYERAILDYLVRRLSKFVCWRLREASDEPEAMVGESDAGGLFADLDLPAGRSARPDDYEAMAAFIEQWSAGRPLDVSQPTVKNTIRRMAATAIEVFFMERFVQLAKPGGIIAVIVPESILASDRLCLLRSWLMEQVVLLAVATLPQKVFSGVGANARTGIFFARRHTLAEQRAVLHAKPIGGVRMTEELSQHKVFMFSPRPEDAEYSLEGYFSTMLDLIQEKRGLAMGAAPA
jgi:SAM-dependent methyltransferase